MEQNQGFVDANRVGTISSGGVTHIVTQNAQLQPCTLLDADNSSVDVTGVSTNGKTRYV